MTSHDASLVVIAPGHSDRWRDARDAWARRDLLGLIARRHLQVRYKQAALGAAWVLLQPAATMAIFVVVFGRLARMPSDGMPYSVFYLSALVPWTYFTSAFANATNSLIDNPGLVTRVHLPRAFLPLGAILAGLVDLALGTVLLVVVVVASDVELTWRFVGVIPATALLVAMLVGLCLSTSALNARYRDVRLLVPFVTQVLLFASPIVYSSSLVPPRWLTVYYLNPLAVAVTGFRWSVAGGPHPPLAPSLGACALVTVLVVSGSRYFRRATRTIADRV